MIVAFPSLKMIISPALHYVKLILHFVIGFLALCALDPANKKDGGEFSLNGYSILLRATWFDNRMSNIRKMNMSIPIIFVSGDQDPVGGLGKGVKKAYDKFAAAGVSDLSIKLYEGDRHEILNELDRKIVYDDLYNWMRERF